MSAKTYHLPDLLSLFPKKPGPEVNSHFQEVNAAFHAWLQSQNALPGDSAAIMVKSDATLFVAMVWPKSSYEWLVGVVNWTGATFLLDDLMDRIPKEDVSALVHSWLDMLRDGKTLQHPLVAVIKNDLLPSMKTALGSYHWPQFVRENERWLLYVIQEAHGREAYQSKSDVIDGIQGHLRMRRGTSASYACLAITRSNCCSYIPEDVLAHPTVDEMTNAAVDVLTITNDIYSFEKEYNFDKAFGNTLTAIWKNEEASHLDMQTALDYSGKLVEASIKHFHACVRKLPSVSPEIDAYLASYAEAMIDNIVGNLQWSRVCSRYDTFANEEDRRNNIVRWAL